MSNYPTVRPSLTLDFQKSKQLDPRIAFSRASSATYVEGGVVKYADEHQARFEDEGLLIEESRTNLLTYSEQFDQWSLQANTAVTTNAIQAPDGSMTADLITGLNNNSGVILNSSTSNTTTYTVSIYVKAGDDTTGNLRVGISGNYVEIQFNLSAETFTLSDNGTSTALSGDLQLIGNGWYRVNVVGSAIGTTSSNVLTNGRLYMWGAQLEPGSSHTSLIPTSGSASTRALDIARITGDNFSSWFNKSEGTMLVSMSDGVRSDFGANLYGSHSADRIVMLASSNGRFRYQATGRYTPNWTSVNIYSANDVRTAGPMKYAYAYKPYDYALSVKGSTLTTQRDPQPNVITLKLGEESSFGGNGRPNAAISRIAYYPERLTNAQLEAITS
jgi:hypothetical protein